MGRKNKIFFTFGGQLTFKGKFALWLIKHHKFVYAMSYIIKSVEIGNFTTPRWVDHTGREVGGTEYLGFRIKIRW